METVAIEATDGVELVFRLFRPAGVCAAQPAPLLLWNHGYPERGTDRLIDAAPYLERGYAFLSLDQRGILGESGGFTSGAPRPGIEDADAALVLDWVHAEAPWVARDPASGLPRDLVVGTFGNGAGGHLGVLLAARDARIDALLPYVHFASVLDDVFAPNEAIRAFTATLFLDFSVSFGVRFEPELLPLIDAAGDDFVIPEPLRDVWRTSDLAPLAGRVEVPTLFVQPLPDQVTNGLRAALRTRRALGTRPEDVWLIGMNAPFFDPTDDRGFGVGAPDRERVNQCASLFTPGFAAGGIGRFLDGELVFLFFDAFLKGDADALARMRRVPHVVLPAEQEGCVVGESWPLTESPRVFALGDLRIPEGEGALEVPLVEATETTLVAGTTRLRATTAGDLDVLFLGTLVVRSGERRYVAHDQVLGAQTGPFGGALDIELGSVVTRLEPGDELLFVLEGESFLYSDVGSAPSEPAVLRDVELEVPIVDAALLGAPVVVSEL
ncbi:MAG: CocE/NonD family hydrolase [Myxococcota bacterium]